MKIRNGYVGNSSSSCFICNTNLSLTEIESILHDMISLWNKITNTDDPDLTYDDVFIGPYAGGPQYDKFLATWYGEYNSPATERTKDKIIIESNGDNAIPYPLFELIEFAFDAEREHLG